MKFTNAILNKNGLLQKIPGTDLFEVMESFEWYLDYNNKIGKIVVPKGFKTNFGSIPKGLRIFFDPTKYISYILHDYIWSPDSIIHFESGDVEVSFYESNDILRQALTVEGASKTEIFCIFNGLQYTIFPYFNYLKAKDYK